MTDRDAFALAAMRELMQDEGYAPYVAEKAYEWADAMLEERAKKVDANREEES